MSTPLPRRALLAVSVLAWTGLPGCCGGDFRALCQRQLVELSAVVDRAPPSLQPAARAEHASLSRELASSAPGDAGNAARKALSGRIAVAIADWDKKIDEALRVDSLKALSAGKWIGDFWRDGATHLGVHVHIRADGALSNTRKMMHRGKYRLETQSGIVMRVRPNELTFKNAGASNKELTFVTDAPPRPLVGTQLGFIYGGDRYLLV